MGAANRLIEVHGMLHDLKKEMESETKSMGHGPTRNFIEYYLKKVKKIIKVSEGE